MKAKTKHRRRASMSIMVLGTSLVVMVIGLSALMVVRIQRRKSEGWNDFGKAQLHAQSAIEKGLFLMDENPNWRTTYPSGVWEADQPIGEGTYTLEGTDPDDGDLGNSGTHPLVLTGIGVQGQARHLTEVTLVPHRTPLEALNTCIHAAVEIQVRNGKSLTVTAAPASTNGNLDNGEILYGDVEAATQTGSGVVTGATTIPVPAKSLPAPDIFADYVAKATVIPYTGNIRDQVLTATYNPWGSPNPDGVYFIDTAGRDLYIEDTRIHGTLLVDCPGKKVVIQEPNLLQNYRSDYPVLIINGNLEVKLKSAYLLLDESSRGINLNPVGAAYQGSANADIEDTYPNEIQGLVHVRGDISLFETTRIQGAVISEANVVINGDPEIIHNPTLYTSPPEGYIEGVNMVISQGTWKRVVN